MAKLSSGGDEDGEEPSSYCLSHDGSSGSLRPNGDGSISIALTDSHLLDCETLAIPVFQVGYFLAFFHQKLYLCQNFRWDF